MRLDDLRIFKQTQRVSRGVSDDTIDMNHEQFKEPLKAGCTDEQEGQTSLSSRWLTTCRLESDSHVRQGQVTDDHGLFPLGHAGGS